MSIGYIEILLYFNTNYLLTYLFFYAIIKIVKDVFFFGGIRDEGC